MSYRYNEGQTGAILRTLLQDGSALDGTGLTLSLVLKDRANGLVPISGKVSWHSQSTGVAKYEPAGDDLKAVRSPYTAQWWVTDGNGDSRPAPQGEPETWKIWP